MEEGFGFGIGGGGDGGVLGNDELMAIFVISTTPACRV
jgi:hypothetical protein